MCSFLAVASAAAQTPSNVRSASGCYALMTSPWSPIVGSDSDEYRIPTVIRLDTIRSGLGLGWALSPNIAYVHASAMPPSWNLSGDTIRLVWSNGTTPTHVMLLRRDFGWAGEAVAESDDHPSPEEARPRAKVTARRQACAAAPH